MNHELARIPYLGVGIGLRTAMAEETLRHGNELDVLEIVSENFLSGAETVQPFLERFAGRFPIIPHGVKLSIGSAVPLDEGFLKRLRGLTEKLHATYYSDHFTLSHHGIDADINHLSPLWFTKEMLDHLVARIERVQQALGVPLVLENITAPFEIGEADYEEPEFIAEVCARTGCGLLLDLTNLNINAYNRKEDALSLLRRYPLDSVVQVHLAGGVIRHDYFYDTHSEPLTGPNELVWELLDWAARRASLKAVIIERDSNFPKDFESDLLRDVRRARAIVERAIPRGQNKRGTRRH